jgi:transposase-like protein
MASKRESMSEASPRVFFMQFKVDLVAPLERGEPVARVARESGVTRKLLYA